MKKIGFLINPIAGLGGQAGMKGSDRIEGRRTAAGLGYTKTAGARAYECIKQIREEEGFRMIAPEGEMGGDALAMANIPYEKLRTGREITDKGITDREITDVETVDREVAGVKTAAAGITTRKDTLRYAKILKERGIDLLVFCGGDGTARDIYEAVGSHVPVLAVPAGVKMYSACYAVSPYQAGSLLRDFIRGRKMSFDYREIMDIDEEDLDNLSVSPVLYGFLQSLNDGIRIQKAKEVCGGNISERENLAEYIFSAMEDDTLYIIGPGGTTYCLKERLEGEGTLRGVDVARGRRIILKDADERGIFRLLEEGMPAKIIVTCIGGNGFLFGRGNQQISPRIIRKVTKENLILAVTKEKLLSLRSAPMLADTGEKETDRYLCGYYKIGVSHYESVLYKVDTAVCQHKCEK